MSPRTRVAAVAGVLAIALVALASRARADDAGEWTPSESGADRARTALRDGLHDIEDRPEGLSDETLEFLGRRASLADLVSFIDQPWDGDWAREQRTALQLVKRAKDAARPYLARALAPQVTAPPSVALLDAIRAVGDDRKGVVEKPLAARVSRALDAQEDAPDLIATLGKIGGAAAFSALADALVAKPLGANLQHAAAAADAILARQKDADKLLAPVLAKVVTLDDERLKEVLPLLGRSRGAAVKPLADLVRRLDAETDRDATGADVDPCFAACLGALASVGTKDAIAAIARTVQVSSTRAHRTRAIRSLALVADGAKLDSAAALVSVLEGTSDEEVRTTVTQVLVDLTGAVRSEPSDWRDLIAQRRAETAKK